MNTPAMTTSTTGNTNIINKSNEQELPLGFGQESKEFDQGSMTTSSASSRSASNLQIDAQQVPAPGEPLLEYKGQIMLRSIINDDQYDLCRELRGLVRISETQAQSGRFLIRLSDSLFLAPQSDSEKK
jgi:hypothetical protein